MDKRRKTAVIFSTIGMVMLLVGVTYSFFNYTRTGISNTIYVGRIAFNSNQTNTITLLDVFPIDSSDVDTSTDVGTATITITGDTEYTEGVEYQLTVSNLTNTINNKFIPIDVVVTATGLGTEDSDYFTNRGLSASTSIYKVLGSGTISNNQQLLVGYIKEGSTGVNGTVTIKAYLDKEKIAISDTYYENATTTPTPTAPNDMYGTTTEWTGDRVVLTTDEWNLLNNTGVSFQVKVEANQGTWTKNPILCKRVTNVSDLHTEQCINSNTSHYCQGYGYTLNSTITYGNAVNLGTDTLTVGDAFDCDVNGNGQIDVDGNNKSTERFYYVSPYYDSTREKFDNMYATLIYYSNTIDGNISDSGAAYDLSNENWHGPTTAVTHLPTTSTWSNVTLKNNTRAILAEYQTTHNSKTTIGGTLPTDFSYSGKAARLLAVQELMKGCGLTEVGYLTFGELNNCIFLNEGTDYADLNKNIVGVWLESPISTFSNVVWDTSSWDNTLSGYNTSTLKLGVRPVIEVPLSRIVR